MNSDKVIPALGVMALLGVLVSAVGILFSNEILMRIGSYIVFSYIGVLVLFLIAVGIHLIFWGD